MESFLHEICLLRKAEKENVSPENVIVKVHSWLNLKQRTSRAGNLNENKNIVAWMYNIT